MAAAIENPERLDDPVSRVAGESFPVVESDTGIGALSRQLTRDVPAVLVRNTEGLRGILTRYDLLHHVIGD